MYTLKKKRKYKSYKNTKKYKNQKFITKNELYFPCLRINGRKYIRTPRPSRIRGCPIQCMAKDRSCMSKINIKKSDYSKLLFKNFKKSLDKFYDKY